jgi:hypothetical protein
LCRANLLVIRTQYGAHNLRAILVDDSTTDEVRAHIRQLLDWLAADYGE